LQSLAILQQNKIHIELIWNFVAIEIDDNHMHVYSLNS